MLRTIAPLLLALLVSPLFGQTDFNEGSVEIKKSHTFDPRAVKPSFDARLQNLEAPTPDGTSYKSFLMRQKIKSREQYEAAQKAPQKKKIQVTAPQPLTGKGMNITLRRTFGWVTPFSGGIPNDNTLGVSNGGLVLAAVNSAIWGYDLSNDTVLFTQSHTISLRNIGDSLGSSHVYDPKLIYDEEADRFILVFLRDNSPQSSAIIIAFSSTNNPADPWHIYAMQGNPLNNNRWTDFPAINITEDELFITGNLIIPDEPWQIGFDGSVIWQIDKNAGYNNDPTLPNKLYSDIRFNGRYIRNLHPVTGTGSITKEQFFLSNRNFDVSNDTIFVLRVKGTLNDPATTLHIGMGKTTPSYGVPPNGRQQDTDLNDPTKGLQTNDARVLGAITNGEWIQFVANTINPTTGFSAVYHGFIEHPGEPEQEITGSILGDPVLDFGYPNIAYTGNEDCDIEAIIGVNFTSPTDYPGVGAFYYSNDSSYSDFLRIKDGESYVDKHQDSYERWGDYFGIQRKHNESGKVWIAGFYGLQGKSNGTWINELATPDSSFITANAEISGNIQCCAGTMEVQASGGVAPYSYSFNGGPASTTNSHEPVCLGDMVVYVVTDSRGCSFADTVYDPGDPSSNDLSAQVEISGKTVFCQGRLDVNPSGGTSPYSFAFNGDSATESNYYGGICDGDTVFYTVIDSCGSSFSDTVYTERLVTSTEDAAYPNPFSGNMVTQFRLESDSRVQAYLFDMNGAVMEKLIDTQAKKGLNEFQFNLAPLGQGTYILRIMADEQELLVEKIVKQD